MSCFSLICEYMYVVVASPLIILGVAPVPTGIQSLLENTPQIINVNSDDVCMITQENFQEGTVVEKCKQCHIVFHSDSLQKWLKRALRKQCIVCENPYIWTHFIKGQAHLIPQVFAVPRGLRPLSHPHQGATAPF
jgi:hypothetical protein